MLPDTRVNALEIGRDRSFAALMELYESNYIFIRRLVPDIDRSDDAVVSRVNGTPDLHLTIVERCAYTTSLRLTHRFDHGQTSEVTPDLQVRVYHDARVSEVLPSSNLEGFRYWRHHRPPRAGSLAWRWEVNRFLNRWLRYCLGEGHAFEPNGRSAPAARPTARRWSA
jgi:uncharacterized protein YqiB (DUF1249 family)